MDIFGKIQIGALKEIYPKKKRLGLFIINRTKVRQKLNKNRPDTLSSIRYSTTRKLNIHLQMELSHWNELVK